MHLYLIRHADPDYEENSLTSQGRLEAQALAARLAADGLDALYASDTVRATETARYTAARLDLSVQILPWLREPDALHITQQGRRYCLWDTFGETIRADSRLPTQQDWHTRAPFDTPDVLKMWQTFRNHCDLLLAQQGYLRESGRYRVQASSRKRLAFFCHNATVLLFLAHLLELPLPLVWCGFYSWPSAVTTVYFEEQSQHWAVPRALHVADVSHLYAAGLRPQPRAMGDRYEAYW